MSDEPSSFFTELKRRNVFRVALAYLVATWLLIQIAATIFPYVGLPDSGVTLVIVVLAIGFFPTLIFAWAFELTPEGIKRETDFVRSDADVVQTARKLDYVIIAMLGVALAMFGYERFGRPATPAVEISVTSGPPSIAVLPFENRSASAADVYFVDGVHDDILTSLAKIGSMQVISRTSVEQFKDTERTIREIGAMLGVGLILEGGVQRAGERIRINVQLIDVQTDVHLWAETYNRQLTAENIFSIQSEIANTIAVALRTVLTPEEQMRLAVIPTDNLEAYEAYMLGNQRLRRRTGPTIEDAVTYFQRAIDLDPNFALAHVGLADSYVLLRSYTNRRWDELEPLARASADIAIQLDAMLGEAIATLAMIEHESKNYEVAEGLFIRALELSPNYASAHQWYGEHLGAIGQLQPALAELQLAVRIDPLSPIVNYILGTRQTDLGLHADAEASFRKVIEIDEGFARAYQGLAILYFRYLGRLDDAAIMANKSRLFDPGVGVYYALLANIYINMGDTVNGARWLDELRKVDSADNNVVAVSSALSLARQDAEAAEQVMEEVIKRFPRAFNAIRILHQKHRRRGEMSDILALYEAGFQELIADGDPDINGTNYRAALGLAQAYQLTDQPERANLLLREVQALIDARSVTPLPGFAIEDVQALALRGKTAQAITALQRHVDAGWRYYTFYYLDQDPLLESIRGEPDFIALREEVREDLARQRDSLAVKWAAEFD